MTRHIATLDGLRGVAALAVLVLHTNERVMHALDPVYAHLAVDFFFMLSGYVIAMAYERRLMAGLPLSRFAGIRLRRLYPMIVLGVILGAVTFCIRHVIKHDIAIEDIAIASLFALALLPTNSLSYASEDGLYPINAPHWSLFFELAINVVYALSARRLTNRVLALALVGTFIGLCASSAGYGQDVGLFPANFWAGFPRVAFPFLAGVALYRFAPAMELARDYSPVLGIFLLGLLLFPYYPKGWFWELSVITLVFPPVIYIGAHCNAGTRTAIVLLWLGDLSYPLYASHVPVIRIIHNVVQLVHLEQHGLLVGVVAIAASIGVALSALRFWDRPVRQRLDKRGRLALIGQSQGLSPRGCL